MPYATAGPTRRVKALGGSLGSAVLVRGVPRTKSDSAVGEPLQNSGACREIAVLEAEAGALTDERGERAKPYFAKQAVVEGVLGKSSEG